MTEAKKGEEVKVVDVYELYPFNLNPNFVVEDEVVAMKKVKDEKGEETEVEDLEIVEDEVKDDEDKVTKAAVTKPKTVKVNRSFVELVEKDGKTTLENALTKLKPEHAAKIYVEVRKSFVETLTKWTEEVSKVSVKVKELQADLDASKKETKVESKLTEEVVKTKTAQLGQLNKWAKEKTAQVNAGQALLAAADKDKSFGMVPELDAEGKNVTKDVTKDVEKVVDGKKETTQETVKENVLELAYTAQVKKFDADFVKLQEKDPKAVKGTAPVFLALEAYQVATLMARTTDIMNFDHNAQARIEHTETDKPLLVSQHDEMLDNGAVKNYKDYLKQVKYLAIDAKDAPGKSNATLRNVGKAAMVVAGMALVLAISVSLIPVISPATVIPAALAFANLTGAMAAGSLAAAAGSIALVGGTAVLASAAGTGMYFSKASGASRAAKDVVDTHEAKPAAPKA